jgi:hypothetical protein
VHDTISRTFFSVGTAHNQLLNFWEGSFSSPDQTIPALIGRIDKEFYAEYPQEVSFFLVGQALGLPCQRCPPQQVISLLV